LSHLLDLSVVLSDLTFRLGDLPLMLPTRYDYLPAPFDFAALMIFLSLPKRFLGDVCGSFVALLATEDAADTSWRFGLKVHPLRRRQGDSQLAKVKRRGCHATPPRVDVDPGISRERRLQQALKFCYPTLDSAGLDRCLLVSVRSLLRRTLALTSLVLLLS
jgi:hypothetical protein